MRALLAVLLASACLLPAVSTPAAAQEAAAPVGMPLWFHVGDDNFVSELKDDPAGTGTEYYRNFLWPALAAGDPVVDTFTSTWTPSEPTPFLAGAPVVVSLTVGTNVGWSATWGSIEVSTRLMADDVQVMAGEAKTVEIPPGTSDYFQTLVWEMPPEIPVLPAGAELQWVLEATGASSDYVISASDTYGGHSHVVLPIALAAEPSNKTALNVTLPDVPVAWNTTHVEPYEAVEQYTWNSTLASALLSFAGNATAGNATVRVTDPLGVVQLETELVANVSLEPVAVELLAAEAGNWTLNVTYRGFTGSMSFAMDPLTLPTPDVAGNNSSNATANAGGKGLPGIGPVLLVGALMALAVVVRRREE